MSQVAEYAGVSQPTVSHVINGRGDRLKISSDTQARIWDAIRTLNYQRNAAARATRTGRFGCAALLMSTTADGRSALPSELLHAIHAALAQRNMHLTVAELTDEQLTTEGELPKILRELSVDGLLVNYTHRTPPRLTELLDAQRLPRIWINTHQPAACVCPADRDAGARATRHLLELGHRRIGFVDTFVNEHYSHAERYRGHAHALRDAGLTPRPPFTLPAPHAGAEATDLLGRVADAVLSASERPTAVVTYSVEDAAALVVEGLRRGLDIPRDLSIVALDVRPVDCGSLPLTCFHVDTMTVGREAVRLLHASDPPAPLPPPLEVPFLFRQGRSTSPPANPT